MSSHIQKHRLPLSLQHTHTHVKHKPTEWAGRHANLCRTLQTNTNSLHLPGMWVLSQLSPDCGGEKRSRNSEQARKTPTQREGNGGVEEREREKNKIK